MFFRASGLPGGAMIPQGAGMRPGGREPPIILIPTRATPFHLFSTLSYNNISCHQNILLPYKKTFKPQTRCNSFISQRRN